MNINKILIIIIIIIIIFIILINNKEHFDETNTQTTIEALNNITNQISNENIKSKKITISNIDLNVGDKTLNIIDILYPINSIYLSSNNYDINNKDKLIGTPLYFGKWKKLNNNEYNVIGLIKNNEISDIKGDNMLNAKQLPSHSHKGIFSNSSREPKGSGSGKKTVWATHSTGHENNHNDYLIIKNSIGIFKDNKYIDYSTIEDKDKIIIPKGYYIYGYQRIE